MTEPFLMLKNVLKCFNFDKTDDEPENILPPIICLNQRRKIEPEEIPVTDLAISQKAKPLKDASLLVWQGKTPSPPQPAPRHPLTIAWSPLTLCFDLYEEKIVQRLKVWNSSSYTIYVQCCGLWNESARLGASWWSYPRGRFRLAPGLVAHVFVSARPREFPSPVPRAYVGLQLAASHTRDIVTGYFVIPIQVTFRSYIPPPRGEGG